jgi:hypothetical protein
MVTSLVWLEGFKHRKAGLVGPVSGAGAGYQVKLTVHYGVGTDLAADVYCSRVTMDGTVHNLCRTNFGDVRFTDEAGGLLSSFMESKVDGDNAVFWVNVAGSLSSTSQKVYVYFGKSDGVTNSSADNTFVVPPIPGVVGAWDLGEADQEVNPTIIADETASTWSAYNVGVGSYSVTLSNGVNISVGAGSSSVIGVTKEYATPLDLSSKSVFKFKFTGANTGLTWSLLLWQVSSANKVQYQFIDNFTGERPFAVPYGSFTTVSGTPNWASVKDIYFYTAATSNFNVNIRRVIADVGVPALDKSGYGNNGTATSTTVVASPFRIGKNARQLQGISTENINCGNNTGQIATNLTWCFWVQVANTSGVSASAFISRYLAVGNNRDFYIKTLVADSKSLQVYASTDGTSGTVSYVTWDNALNLGTSTCIIITKQGSTLTAYKNGVSLGSQTLTFWGSSVAPFCIGSSGAGHILTGIIGDVIIFDTALTPTQVNNIYNNLSDAGLITGSICIRKYVYPEPTWTTWTPLETSIKGASNNQLLPLLQKLNENLEAQNNILCQKLGVARVDPAPAYLPTREQVLADKTIELLKQKQTLKQQLKQKEKKRF